MHEMLGWMSSRACLVWLELIDIVCVTYNASSICKKNTTAATYLLVHDHVHFHALFGFALEDAVETPFLVERRGAAQVDFRRQPPVLRVARSFPSTITGTRSEPYQDEDGLARALQDLRECVHIVVSVDVPVRAPLSYLHDNTDESRTHHFTKFSARTSEKEWKRWRALISARTMSAFCSSGSSWRRFGLRTPACGERC